MGASLTLLTVNANTSETLDNDASVAMTFIERIQISSLVGVPMKFLVDESKVSHVGSVWEHHLYHLQSGQIPGERCYMIYQRQSL